jgi:4-amino-4-deoxy-L-arabinose transferase-like glycosyltransferase
VSKHQKHETKALAATAVVLWILHVALSGTRYDVIPGVVALTVLGVCALVWEARRQP